jgi:ubiquinone/menaquinone biosynthesis C-methylase UbiE
MPPGRLSERLEGLPPERRKLVEQLLGGTAGGTTPAARPREGALNPEALRAFDSPGEQVKAGTRQFYNAINDQLAATIFGEHSAFLNYGYVADGSPRYARVDPPLHAVNRTSVALVLELVGEYDLTGKRVLDVGCGRGGTILVIDKYFRASLKTGLDLSSAAIDFCRRAHQYRNTSFLEGDAERLPFADATYDTVTSVESSHSYPDIASFYREVRRVLRRSGCFLYTDVFTPARFAAHLETLRDLGFVVEHDRDITNNVLLSCHQTAELRSRVFDGIRESAVIGEFLSVPGSSVFDEMQSGRAVYRILRLRSA